MPGWTIVCVERFASPRSKGYMQVFEDMPGDLKVGGSVQEKPMQRQAKISCRGILEELGDICRYCCSISFHSGSRCRRRRCSPG